MAADHAQRDIAPRDDSLLARHIGQTLHVVGKADDHRGTEITHELDLLDRGGFDARAGGDEQRLREVHHGLADVVSAVDKTVAVDGMHDVGRTHAGHQVGARQHQVLDFARARAEE